MHYREKIYKDAVLVGAVAALLLAGCATTSPGAKFKEALAKDGHIDANDITFVKIETGNDVAIEEFEKQRLARVIQEKVDALKMKNTEVSDPREFELIVALTRYDKGNAFARAMMPGLGKIHIDAQVAVFELPTRKKVADFDVDKTFAWGGLYGGATSIGDVEKGFAEGVAEAVTKAKK
jgi:hypothetical protein